MSSVTNVEPILSHLSLETLPKTAKKPAISLTELPEEILLKIFDMVISTTAPSFRPDSLFFTSKHCHKMLPLMMAAKPTVLHHFIHYAICNTPKTDNEKIKKIITEKMAKKMALF